MGIESGENKPPDLLELSIFFFIQNCRSPQFCLHFGAII
jgi:hypothetical protein